MVGVAVWEPVGVDVPVGVGENTRHEPGAVPQTALGVNVPPPSSHSDWVMMPLQSSGSIVMQHPVGTHPHSWPTWRQPIRMGHPPARQAVVDVISSHGCGEPARAGPPTKSIATTISAKNVPRPGSQLQECLISVLLARVRPSHAFIPILALMIQRFGPVLGPRELSPPGY
jgi:hypothetical protein